MPRRRDKRTDTENSDEYEEKQKFDRNVHFGTNQMNRLLAPDQIEGDDISKYSIRAWSNTLMAQRLLPWAERKLLFLRAIECLPYSYKIWHMYLREFMEYNSKRSLISVEYTELNNAFDESLNRLPKMPRIWLLYAECLSNQHLISKTRAVYNWSFRNLPLTQHEKIWKKFTQWAMQLDSSATALSIIPRYLKLNPDFKGKYVEYLKRKEHYDLCVNTLKAILDDEGYNTMKDKREFFFEMVDLYAEHPHEIKRNGEMIMRKGLEIYPNEAGRLWVKLSDYYIRLAEFENAREILEEALEKIDNAKDFGIIFSAYCKFEEEMITALANNTIRTEYGVTKEDNVDEEIEMRMNRLEELLRKQPFLLHRISLRKNKNNIKAWVGLIKMSNDAIGCCEEAIASVDPQLAENGRFSEVWLEYAQLVRQDIKRCNEIFFMATNVNFKTVEDYVNVWISWIEMLIEEGYPSDGLKVVKNVLFRRKSQANEEIKIKNIEELLKGNPFLWQLYIDLESNLGTFEGLKTAYERCKEHRSLIPLMLLNYVRCLWENAYFEETFRVFEFAVSNFKWPALLEIWLDYLTKLINRHGDSPLGVERIRSTFERLLSDCPPEHKLIFYFLYLEFEEEYGMHSHVVEVCDRMVNAVLKQEKFKAYCIYIVKVANILGITKTRSVFESALQVLSEKDILYVGEKYAQLETDLAEIERARAVYTYISQFTDPRDDEEGLWTRWEQFEVEQGDKDTYKEYLRIKRSVEAKYSMLPPDLEKIEARVKKGLV